MQITHSLSSQTFNRGEASYFILKNPCDLGYLYSLRIWHDSSGEGKLESWNLSHVVVVDPQRRIWFVMMLFKKTSLFDTLLNCRW